MKTILRKQALNLIKNSDTIFSVEFVKKDNTRRKMTARKGVKKYLKGGTMPYKASEYGYITVFDMKKLEYRLINLNTLEKLNINGHKYEVIKK